MSSHANMPARLVAALLLVVCCAGGCATAAEAARARLAGIVLVVGGAVALPAGATVAIDCAATKGCTLARGTDHDTVISLMSIGAGLILFGSLLWYASTLPVTHPDPTAVPAATAGEP